MWDWSLGQAGFGEQIRIYGETYWQQVGAAVLWASAAILAVLALVTFVLMLSGRRGMSEETGRLRRPAEAPPKAPARPAGRGQTSRTARRAA